MSETNNTESMADFKDELEASFRKINVGDILTGTIVDVSEDAVTLDLNYYAPGIITALEFSDDPDFSILSLEKGSILEATVIQKDDGFGNILLSKKEANSILAWDTLKEDFIEKKILTVKVKESVNGGVVCYVEGIRAFIPASQLATYYVEDTTEFVGKELLVRIITLEPENDKLVLSAKSVAAEQQKATHDKKVSMIAPGSVLEGTVETLMPYGAFINLGDGLSGLVHISQICEKRINKPSEILKEGQTVKVKVINTNDGKISLSMRALEEEMVDTSPEDIAALEEFTSKETASTNLGDLLKNFKLN